MEEFRKPILNKPRLVTPSSSRDGTHGKTPGSILQKRIARQNLEKQVDGLLDELDTSKKHVGKLMSILEGVVRLAGGEVALSIDFLEEHCMAGNITLEGREPRFLVIKLGASAAKLESVPPPRALEEPMPMSPEARIAYEAAYAKAMDEDDRSVRLVGIDRQHSER